MNNSVRELTDYINRAENINNEFIARNLARLSPVVTINQTNREVLELLSKYKEIIGLPVLENQNPIGLINRKVFMNEMAKPFRRDLFAGKSCTIFMDHQPLIVDQHINFNELSIKVISSSAKSLNDGFIVTGHHGRYLGIGTADDLVKVVSSVQTEKNRLLLQSENRFRTFSELLPQLVWSAIPNGALDYVNQRMVDVLGIAYENIIHSGWFYAIHPDDRSKYIDVWKQSLISGQSYEIDCRLRHRSGDFCWYFARVVAQTDVNGQILKWHGTLTDITERKETEMKLLLMAQIFESTLESVMIMDAQANIIDVNEAFTKISGYSREEVLGKAPQVLNSAYQNTQFYHSIWQAIKSTGHWAGEIWNSRKNGDVYSEWLRLAAIYDSERTVTHYVGIASDNTIQKQQENKLKLIAHYDGLTGIPNRVLLIERMREALNQHRRLQKLLAVCYLDVDGFKLVNDHYGHNAGDTVLVEIARRIEQNIRGGDTAARIGGDEFVILLLCLENIEECYTILQRLLNAIAEPIAIHKQTVKVTASLGVTFFPDDNEDGDTLLRHADHAMYISKQSGKNCFHTFDRFLDAQVRNHHEEIIRLADALKKQEFVLFFQPKVDMQTMHIVGAEALIRWQHPDLGLLPPCDFLPTIENSYLDIAIGEWVISKALDQILVWEQSGWKIEVAINISAQHLQTEGFAEYLKNQLKTRQEVLTQFLQIEILETAALENISKVIGIIESCCELGINFALDDFGTGYSSLSYLRRLPVQTLKIDQTFVRDMLNDDADAAIVKGIIGLAESFNRQTVAEGVETMQHFEALKLMGCDIAQGYGIAKPMPAQDFIAWCEMWSRKHNLFCNGNFKN